MALAILVILAGLIFNTQERDIDLEKRWPQISDVRLEPATGDQRATLHVEGAYDRGCVSDLLSEISFFPHNIAIQVLQFLPASAQCQRDDGFSLAIEITADWTGQAIAINEQVWDASESDDGKVLPELSRFPILLDEARWSAAGDLRLRGSQAIGCELPLLFSWRTDGETTLLTAFNAVAPDIVCPDVLVEVDETIRLSATEWDSDTLLVVNGRAITELERQSMSESDKVLTNISEVKVTVRGSAPARVSLDVAGEHPDGCDFPVLVAQSRRGNTIEIEVYREVPLDVICPMILRPYRGTIEVDGTLAAATYTIKVNDHSQTVDI